MKTLVKYVKGKMLFATYLTKRGSTTVMMQAEELTRRGLGDNTVQEDGRTVYIGQNQVYRLS